MTFEEQFETYLKAGSLIVQIVSYETERIHGIINSTADNMDREWYAWNRVEGLKKWNSYDGQFEEADESLRASEAVLDFYCEYETAIILILEGFHPDLSMEQVNTIQRLRNISFQHEPAKTLVLMQPHQGLPCELEKEVAVLELPLPDRETLKVIFDQVCSELDLNDDRIEESDEILDAALGLTIMEAKLAFSKAIVEKGRLTELEIPIIVAEKEQIIKKSGFLEYYHPKEDLNDVGGLDQLKNWLQRRGKAFKPGAEEFGLDRPKGVLLLGVPGTGKSLCAKAISSAWMFPLLRLDMGKIFGGIVGESEKNIRTALSIAETISPSILWIDEIEKGLSGASSSGSTDGGTTSRVLGTFLTWMQEKKSPVFVIATANDVSKLPPELLRKGRVDEIFFVDLPGLESRKEIMNIHLQKKGRGELFGSSDLEILADISNGFSGAELEEVVKEALFKAYDAGDDLNMQYLEETIQSTYPLSRTMGETIYNMREWVKGRAVFASSEEPANISKSDSKKPRLKQESQNPFINGNPK